MARNDRKRRLERYEALLTRQSDPALLNSFDALIRVISVKRRRSKADAEKRARGERTLR